MYVVIANYEAADGFLNPHRNITPTIENRLRSKTGTVGTHELEVGMFDSIKRAMAFIHSEMRALRQMKGGHIAQFGNGTTAIVKQNMITSGQYYIVRI